MEHNIIQAFQELGTRYGFRVSKSGNSYTLYAKNTDHQWSAWIQYDPGKEIVSLLGNTDHLNLWFHETRKDLTPERCITFAQELNKVFGLPEEQQFQLCKLIDPEDWQEIAQVQDAFQDSRYLTGKLPALKARLRESQDKINHATSTDRKPDPIR